MPHVLALFVYGIFVVAKARFCRSEVRVTTDLPLGEASLSSLYSPIEKDLQDGVSALSFAIRLLKSRRISR